MEIFTCNELIIDKCREDFEDALQREELTLISG